MIANQVLATDQFKWFYWIGPILAVSAVGLLAAIALGYYVRILRPKWRGRQAQ